MNTINPVLNTDSYKLSHFQQYPEGATRVASYIESRGGNFEEVMFLGLQAFIKEYLMTPITEADVQEAAEFAANHAVGGMPFNEAGWMEIVNDYDGYLPVTIQALPEGFIAKPGVPLVQVVSERGFAWLTSYLETAILRAVWYPTTVATQSRAVRSLIRNALLTTQGTDDGLDFKLHDFGARGVSSYESAGIGGMAHLATGALGTDTITGILCADRYYGTEGVLAGYSIPAMEHSTVTSWEREGEMAAFENHIDTTLTSPGSMAALVVDSYDTVNAVRNILGGDLRDKIANSGGTLVVRPDSGDPVEMVCLVLDLLKEKFGGEPNDNGFWVLPDCVRVIQGDGVNYDSITAILQAMIIKGYCISNIAFGMGGKLLQGLDRDTLKFAMKACAIEVNDEWVDVYKDPITDPGKRSKRGRQAVVYNRGVEPFEIEVVREESRAGRQNLLEVVYENGMIRKEYTFAEVRANAAIID